MRLQTPAGTPEWNAGGEHRLLASFLAATVIVALVLSVLRLPVIPDFTPLIELVVRIVQPEEEPTSESRPEPLEQVFAEPAQAEEEAPTPPDAATMQSGASDIRSPVMTESPRLSSPTAAEIEAATQAAIAEALDELENPPKPNPVLAEQRRDFEGTYLPPAREGERPIWENIEKDQLGRSVLRSGNCWKVIDDPNVGSQYQFREFGQYIVMCNFQPRKPQLLPWVPEIVARYPYLRDPDGYLKGIDDPATLAELEPDPWLQRE